MTRDELIEELEQYSGDFEILLEADAGYQSVSSVDDDKDDEGNPVIVLYYTG